MKNNIIKISFIFSIVFCQFLNASENGQSETEQNEVDVSLVPVVYLRPTHEDEQDSRPLSPAGSNDAEIAQAALQQAVQSGHVTINSEDEVTLTVDRQTGEVFVDVTYYDDNGNFAGAFVDRISDGRN